MKISTKTTTVLLAIVAVFAFTVSIARAEETATVDASANTTIKLNPNGVPIKRPPLKTIIDNREANKDVRNNTLEKRVEIMKDKKTEVKDARTDAKEMFKQNKDMRKEIAKKMESRVFEARKNALLKELTLSLTNLGSISTRIEARITKAESEGRTLTDAKALLVTAKAKLEAAKAAVTAFETVTPPTTTTASSTQEVDLTKPRQAGDAAIKAVKEARDAFQKVVTAIAHAMGVKAEVKATSETSGTITN